MPKPITSEGIEQDAKYVLGGTAVSQLLYAIVPPRRGLQVLEVGCGSGKLGLGYAMGGADVTLSDVDPEVLLYTRALRDRLLLQDLKSLVVQQWNLFALPVGPVFDLVFSEGTTHHWPREDPRRAGSVKAMADACKSGGTVVVIGSNAHCPEMMAYAERVDHTYADMPPKQTPLTQDELIDFLERAGLHALGIVPVNTHNLETSTLIAGWGRKL